MQHWNPNQVLNISFTWNIYMEYKVTLYTKPVISKHWKQRRKHMQNIKIHAVFHAFQFRLPTVLSPSLPIHTWHSFQTTKWLNKINSTISPAKQAAFCTVCRLLLFLLIELCYCVVCQPRQRPRFFVATAANLHLFGSANLHNNTISHMAHYAHTTKQKQKHTNIHIRATVWSTMEIINISNEQDRYTVARIRQSDNVFV